MEPLRPTVQRCQVKLEVEERPNENPSLGNEEEFVLLSRWCWCEVHILWSASGPRRRPSGVVTFLDGHYCNVANGRSLS